MHLANDPLSFTEWMETTQGKVTAGQPRIQLEVQFGHPITPGGYVLVRSGPFGAFISSMAVHGGSIADLDAAFGQLYNPYFLSPYDPLLPGNPV
jgi:hypothetical protein